jgi:site-specific DNA-cytosine methylase
VLENVPGLLNAEKGEFFLGVVQRFAEMGYACIWGIYSAAAVGAVHLRKRIWIVAYAEDGRRHTSWYEHLQAWANITPGICSDEETITNTSSNRCQGQLAQIYQRGTGSGLHAGSIAPILPESSLCGNDDGLSSGLDGCLLRKDQLEDWLSVATIPSFSRLSREEIRSLTDEEQEEYRQLYKEYQAIRRQHKEQLKALGNAVVPQCAARIFGILKQILNNSNHG